MSTKPTATLAPQPLHGLPPINVSVARSKVTETVKQIHTDADVDVWKKSIAHQNLILFVSRLCEASVGKATYKSKHKSAESIDSKDPIDRIWDLLDELQMWTQEIEPLKTPQRFGNLAFRTWGQRLEERVSSLHQKLLPEHLQAFASELAAYLLGSFGSWQRLDYGSGHEMSFAAWLCFLARLGFVENMSEQHHEQSSSTSLCAPTLQEERLALEILPKYLEVAWGIQDRYGLEPAGSHGVWGLDDYQFIPYAIGAAQLRSQSEYSPLAFTSASHKPSHMPVSPQDLLQFTPSTSPLPTTTSSRIFGSELPGPPFANLFTSSIARIHSLKRGPFHEHSPILFDVAITVPNWVKVHSGMIKMWTAECLDKRPVVQHFPFGAVGFLWEGLPTMSHLDDTKVREASKSESKNTTRSQIAPFPSAQTPFRPQPGALPRTAAPWATGSQPTTAPQSATAPLPIQTGVLSRTEAPFKRNGVPSRPRAP